MNVANRSAIAALVDDGALVVYNHSGGKDSQAMTIALKRIVPARQSVVIHAPLGEIEWPGTLEHIEGTIGDLPLVLAPAVDRAGEPKTLLQSVRARGRWPSPSQRWCTSDFKRGPIEREIRRYAKAHGHRLIVSAMGMRAQESPKRRKLPTFGRSDRNSKAGRDWYDWLPIHAWTHEEVFATIEAAGERPHWAYGRGMSRLSCSFCIMASDADQRCAAGLRPDLYRRYVELERELGHTMDMRGRPLDELVGIRVPSGASR